MNSTAPRLNPIASDDFDARAAEVVREWTLNNLLEAQRERERLELWGEWLRMFSLVTFGLTTGVLSATGLLYLVGVLP